MNKLSTPILLAALALSLSPAAARTNDAGDSGFISVTSQREQVTGLSRLGALIVSHAVSVRVGVRDLDLASTAGWEKLDTRLRKAGRMACDALDRDQAIATLDTSDCEGDVARGAMRAARENRTGLAAAGSLTFRLAAN
jgi:UrcA family protein